MAYGDEGFRQFSRTGGRLRLEADGRTQEAGYEARNFLNAAGTMGYSAVEVQGRIDYVFLSRTGAGLVLTMPGEQSGTVPFPVEGYRTVTIVAPGSPVGEYYEAHTRALEGEKPVADRAWLEREVPGLPQRALDVTMKIFDMVCKVMDGMMKELGEALEGAMGELAEGMSGGKGDITKDADGDHRSSGGGLGPASGEGGRGSPEEESTPVPAEAVDAPGKKPRRALRAGAAGGPRGRSSGHPRNS